MTAAYWDELGIAETGDVTAIRRAYSARLKQIDADQDPDGFIRLREAYDLARADIAQRAQPPIEAPDAGDMPQLAAEAVSAVAEQEQMAKEVDAEQRPAAPQYDTQAIQRIGVILFGERPPEPTDSQELRELTERILADPHMDLIEHARDVEGWLAEAIAHSDARGDAMLAPVVARFAWDRDASRWDEHPIIAHLVERHKGAEMIARLSNPENQFHHAFLDLTSGSGPLKLRQRGDVIDLINMIRAEAPFAESYLDGDRLQQWFDHFDANARAAEHRDEQSFRFREIAVFGGMAVLLVLSRFVGSSPQPTPPPPRYQPVSSAPYDPPGTTYAPAVEPMPAIENKNGFQSSAERLKSVQDAIRRDGRKHGLSRQEINEMLEAAERLHPQDGQH